MNKVEARSPSNERNWKAIDIFLFSNGQQFSPPRKYHLQAEDLNWWDSTLNYLARSHYGSLHSVIELYTIDGRKIKGPLELSDGTAYVAVVPPDAFIDSGYEKYLIKASRSWEKRQAKKASIVDKSDDGAATCELFVPCCPCHKKCCGGEAHSLMLGHKVASVLEHFLSQQTDNIASATEKDSPPKEDVQSTSVSQSVFVYTVPELTTIKTPDDNIAEASVMVRPQRSSTPKLDKSDTQHPLKSIIAAPKLSNSRNEKRLSAQHPAFVKTGVLPNTPQRKISTLRGKEGFQRKALTKIPIKINENVNGVTSKPKRFTKVSQPAPTSQQPLQSPPAPSPPSPPPKSSHQASSPATTDAYQNTTATSSDKGLTTDTANLDNLICNKEIVVIGPDIPKNMESEIASYLESTHYSGMDEVISCYIMQSSVEEEVQTHSDQGIETVETSDVGVAKSNSKKEIPGTSTQDTNAINCHIPLEDNFIAVINKGDAVNLSLTIELKKSETGQPVSTISNIEHRFARKVSSLTNIFKKEKLLDLKDEETTVQTKSLQSLISSVNDCFAKVVVVQCACCGNNTTIPRIDSMPVYKDDNGFFILMPGPTPAPGDSHSCACGPNREMICIDKKIMSELCLPDPPKSKTLTDFPVITRDAGMVMTIMNCGLPRIEEWQKNVYDTYMMTKQVSINQNQCNVASCCPSSSHIITELVVGRTEQQSQMPYVELKTVESYTQTEWCRLLLQVRCQEDGHYTFHLPPLEMLKYYAM